MSYVKIHADGSIVLPQWLDDYIYSNLKASYCKKNKDIVALEWSLKEMEDYLGTYFPRSFAESYIIFQRYFRTNPNLFTSLSDFSIFDFGCGTGGELVGLILAVKEFYSNISRFHVKALDGNFNAIRILETILNKLSQEILVTIILEPLPIIIDDFYDLGIVSKTIHNSFDCIISFKSICEFVTKQQFEEKNPYKYIIEALIPKLNEGGLFCLADVTSYNKVSQEWLPQMLDSGLIGTRLKVIASNMGHNEEFLVSHSHKRRDNSKIAWRMLSLTK